MQAAYKLRVRLGHSRSGSEVDQLLYLFTFRLRRIGFIPLRSNASLTHAEALHSRGIRQLFPARATDLLDGHPLCPRF